MHELSCFGRDRDVPQSVAHGSRGVEAGLVLEPEVAQGRERLRLDIDGVQRFSILSPMASHARRVEHRAIGPPRADVEGQRHNRFPLKKQKASMPTVSKLSGKYLQRGK